MFLTAAEGREELPHILPHAGRDEDERALQTATRQQPTEVQVPHQSMLHVATHSFKFYIPLTFTTVAVVMLPVISLMSS